MRKKDNKLGKIDRPAVQLKVALLGTEPPVWRRLVVPSTFSLLQLHEVLQIAIGWMNSHLWLFYAGDAVFGPSDGVDDPGDGKDAQRARLASLLQKPGDSICYIYDLGDNWEHDIIVEEVIRRSKYRSARCLAGENAAPPEDCGSTPGFHHLKEVLADPRHEEHQEILAWLDEYYPNYDPREFSLAAVNKTLSAGASKYLKLMEKLYE